MPYFLAFVQLWCASFGLLQCSERLLGNDSALQIQIAAFVLMQA